MAQKNLQENMEIVIRLADNVGMIVMQDYEDHNRKTITILSNDNYYKR